MVISADNSMWMQELQMQKRRIIEAINKYYRQEVITDIRFIMKCQSYVKVETNTSLTIPDEQIITKRINFARYRAFKRRRRRYRYIVETNG